MWSYQQHRSPSVEEREAELITLQSSFDEYIASTRELEHELDEMKEEITESKSELAILSAQLEIFRSQVTSLQHRSPTVAEREAALQSAFDEYIASSKELEDELNEELAKVNEKLTESKSENAVLSVQLKNVSSQVTALQHHSRTVTEMEVEKILLQSVFDDYIANTTELEDELDGEVIKLQGELTESQSANAALSVQLENVSSQVTALESALTSSRQKLKKEQKLRRASEQAQDERNHRLLEMEQSLREQCDDVHEYSKEKYLEEKGFELEIEKQQLTNKQKNSRLELARSSGPHRISDKSAFCEQKPAVVGVKSPAVPEPNDDYVKNSEEELELITHQLTETEKWLNEAEAEIQTKEETNAFLKSDYRLHYQQLLLLPVILLLLPLSTKLMLQLLLLLQLPLLLIVLILLLQ